MASGQSSQSTASVSVSRSSGGGSDPPSALTARRRGDGGGPGNGGGGGGSGSARGGRGGRGPGGASQKGGRKPAADRRRWRAKGGKKKELHTVGRPEYPHPELGRTVITSVATLQSDWRKLPIDVLAECILFLDCAREWVFHNHKGEAAYAFYKTGFDARYVDLEPELRQFLVSKEEDGHVYWWRDNRSWAQASEFFEGLTDPARGHRLALTDKAPPEPLPYMPLILSAEFWKILGETEAWGLGVHAARKLGTHGQKRFPRFTASVQKVVVNFTAGSFEEFAARELMYQSNPSLRFYGYDLTPQKERVVRAEVE